MKKTVTRMCIACREHKPSLDMFRISKAADNDTEVAVLDENQKMQARGAYICKNEKCISIAEKSNAVKRHLKCEPCKELFDRLRERL